MTSPSQGRSRHAQELSPLSLTRLILSLATDAREYRAIVDAGFVLQLDCRICLEPHVFAHLTSRISASDHHPRRGAQ